MDDHDLRVRVHPDPERRHVTLVGRLDVLTAPQLVEATDPMLSGPRPRVTVDMGRLTFVDSAGLAALVRVLRRARGKDGELAVVLPTDPRARRVFRLTKLDEVLPLASEEG